MEYIRDARTHELQIDGIKFLEEPPASFLTVESKYWTAAEGTS